MAKLLVTWNELTEYRQVIDLDANVDEPDDAFLDELEVAICDQANWGDIRAVHERNIIDWEKVSE